MSQDTQIDTMTDEQKQTAVEKQQSDQRKHDDDLSKALSPMFERALGYRPLKKEEDKTQDSATQKTDDEPKDESDKKSADEALEAKKADEEKQKAEAEKQKASLKVSKKTPVNIDESIQKAAEEAAKKTAEQFSKSVAKEPPEEKIQQQAPADVPEEYKELYDALVFLEETNSDKYKGKSAQLIEFIQKENDYIAKWESENEGSTFDPESSEHDVFYKQNGIKYKNSDVETAKIDMRVKSKVEQKMSEQDKKLRELHRREIAREAAPKIASQRINTIKTIMSDVNPDYVKDIETQEGFNKLKEQDPLVADAVMQQAAAFAPIIDEIVLIYDTDMYNDDQGNTVLNPENKSHVALVSIANEAESIISSMDKTSQLDDNGRMFASREDFEKLSDSARKKHWTLDRNVLINFISKMAASSAKKAIEDTKVLHDKYFKAKQAASEEEKQKQHQHQETKVTRSPAAKSDRIDTSTKTQTDEKPTVKDLFGRALFGRRV